jgi:hypothetical protein
MITVLPEVPNRAESNPCPPIMAVAAVANVTVAAPMPMLEPSVPTPILSVTVSVVFVLVARMKRDLQSIVDCAVDTVKVMDSLDATPVLAVIVVPVSAGVNTAKDVDAIFYLLSSLSPCR